MPYLLKTHNEASNHVITGCLPKSQTDNPSWNQAGGQPFPYE